MSHARSLQAWRAAANAKTIIEAGLVELQEWVDEGLLKPRTANLLELNARQHLSALQGQGDAYDVRNAVRNLVEAYELDEYTRSDAQLDPIHELLWKHRKAVLLN